MLLKKQAVRDHLREKIMHSLSLLKWHDLCWGQESNRAVVCVCTLPVLFQVPLPVLFQVPIFFFAGLSLSEPPSCLRYPQPLVTADEVLQKTFPSSKLRSTLESGMPAYGNLLPWLSPETREVVEDIEAVIFNHQRKGMCGDHNKKQPQKGNKKHLTPFGIVS